jgi:hypothetical protein
VTLRLDPEALRDVRTLDDVIAFFAEELDWPIDVEDLEEASFDYSPEELGIPADRVPTLASLSQLRPLTTSQPWGIFFLEFEGPRLPLTPLRRLLQSLVTKKRASGDGSRKTWALNDLLFIITTDSGETVELHLVAFFESPVRGVEIRSLPWRPHQSPPQHLRRLATELLPRLSWPSTEDPAEWRESWRNAFQLRHGEAIASAARLAERMANTAQTVRARVAQAIREEAPSLPTSRETLPIKELLSLGGENGACWDVAGERQREGRC